MGQGIPVGIAAVNDYEMVVAGLAALLECYPDRVEVRDAIVAGEPIKGGPIDLALYDAYGRVGVAAATLADLAAHPEVRRVALFSLDLRPEVVAEARTAGATAFISKALPADQIVDAVVRAAQGEEVEALAPTRHLANAALEWPGKSDGLTERESQVLALLADGLSNAEIGAALYVSRETIKTHLRTIYRRLGVRNRTQAAAHAERSGQFGRHLPDGDRRAHG